MVFATFAVLSVTPGATTGEQASLLGYHNSGDDGGGEFYWDSSSTETANGGTIIAVTGVSTGRWKRVITGPLNVRWFGAWGYTDTNNPQDDTVAISNTINAVPVSETGSIMFPTGTYYISAIELGNRLITIDGQGSSLVCIGNADAAINIINTVDIHDLNISKKNASVTTATVFRISGIRHKFRNIQTGSTFAIVFDCYDMKESHFNMIRVDNDITGYTGNIFSFSYCVNNTISQSMLGYCDNAFYFSSTPHPTAGYKSEGILITECITVYANAAVNILTGTQISLIGNVFDFCRTYGIFQSNGQNLVAHGNWIAARGVNGFIGIGGTVNLTGASIVGNQVQAGATVVSGNAFSFSGKNIIVSGNYYIDLNGGLVTDSSSQVFGNTFSGSATGITNVSGTTIALGNHRTIGYGLPSGASAGTAYSDCGFTAVNDVNASYRAGVKYVRGNYSDQLGQRFYVSAGAGVEKDVFILNENMDVGIPDQGYNKGKFILGNYFFWVDANGRLRIKNGRPTSDTDGTVVGTQV
ncbi:hypothetical protein SIO70_08135 [Chitinophaga sancti]|uniref:hypothetical protein n=1 Tax=Chitinophaga sancti TaxID=1004 RepID=UPI002A74FE92|nr:hypothetical protein [Chitinophaga sancti]WPQ64836.1 hypothetical protein SIO70_08135 [Chitinophaga sancti]